jgi:hypothetical protein
VVVECLSEEQVLALIKPYSDGTREKFPSRAADWKPREDAKPMELECKYCGKVFQSGEKHQRHSLRHETLTPFVVKCVYSGCKQTFCNFSNLKEHAAKHRQKSGAELVKTLQENQPSAENYEPTDQGPETAEEQQELVHQ